MAKNKNDDTKTTDNADTGLNADEMRELLRYFIGNPPYIQDGRFRALVDAFNATDNRPVADDSRTPQSQLPTDENAN
jgi:hypothetical protein